MTAMLHISAAGMTIWGVHMQYWGKVIGVAVALMMGGVVLGRCPRAVGHMFDKARSRRM